MDSYLVSNYYKKELDKDEAKTIKELYGIEIDVLQPSKTPDEV